MKVSEGGGGEAITIHDSATLCLYSLNFVNVSLKRDVAVVVDIRLARPAQTLPGFPLVGGRNRTKIRHDRIGGNSCNGYIVEKEECPLFFPHVGPGGSHEPK